MQNDIYKREYTREFVSRWDDLIGWDGRAEGENGFFERLLRRNGCKTVADIAAGTGFHAIRLAHDGFEVTASDGAETMIRQTAQNAEDMEVQLAETRTVDWRELHKAFGPFFSSAASDEQKQAAHGAVAGRFDYLETLFVDGRDHLLGETFTVADAYMFVVSNWANFVGIDLSRWPNVQAFVGRVAARPSVQAAMVAEGLIPAEQQAS
ncbi:MAG: glutathione binding-like protein [Rhodospirillales bacterium]